MCVREGERRTKGNKWKEKKVRSVDGEGGEMTNKKYTDRKKRQRQRGKGEKEKRERE